MFRIYSCVHFITAFVTSYVFRIAAEINAAFRSSDHVIFFFSVRPLRGIRYDCVHVCMYVCMSSGDNDWCWLIRHLRCRQTIEPDPSICQSCGNYHSWVFNPVASQYPLVSALGGTGQNCLWQYKTYIDTSHLHVYRWNWVRAVCLSVDVQQTDALIGINYSYESRQKVLLTEICVNMAFVGLVKLGWIYSWQPFASPHGSGTRSWRERKWIFDSPNLRPQRPQRLAQRPAAAVMLAQSTIQVVPHISFRRMCCSRLVGSSGQALFRPKRAGLIGRIDRASIHRTVRCPPAT